MMSDKKEHLKSWLNSWVVGGSFPGALLAVGDKNGDELFYHEVDQNILNQGQPKTYKRDSIFRIYSNTKPITTVAALILMERGLLGLHDPLSKYIPAFEHTQVFVSGTAAEPVVEDPKVPLTIHHLMTHTSGIPYSFFGNTPSDVIIRNKVGEDWKLWYMNTELEVLCDKVAEAPLCFQPGTSFLYGLNTDILGRVIEVISGLRLDEFMAKEIFEPLGMVDTGFYVPADKMHRLLDCYDYVPVSHSYKLSTHPERARSVKATLTAGGGGLTSTLTDYARFSRMLLNYGTLEGVQILTRASVELMTSNQLPGGANLVDIAKEGFSESLGDGYGFGLGVAVLTDPSKARGGSLSGQGEYGWGGVANTFFMIDPVNEIYAIFFTQLIPSSAYPIRNQLRHMIHWALQNELKFNEVKEGELKKEGEVRSVAEKV